MKFDVKADLKEGMKIMPIDLFQKGEKEPLYTMVKSSVDGELYGHFRNQVFKMSEVDEENFIVTDLSALEAVDSYIEIKVSDTKMELFHYRDESIFNELEDAIGAQCYMDSEGFSEIPMRVVSMDRESYLTRLHGEDYYDFKLRATIKDYYDNATDMGAGIRIVDNKGD